MPLMLSEVVPAMGGQVDTDVSSLRALGVSTDSRTTGVEEVFFALQGPRFDGHDYVTAALERGATAAVVASARAITVAERAGAALRGRALIRVDDPTAALGRLAAYYRGLLSATIIGVVGSNGKTTTKAMIHHILAGQWAGRCSPQSFNNAIGVPLTLLAGEAKDEYLVVEMGTNAPGEIAALAQLVRPDLVVLTGLAEEHLEGLGDLAGVAAEECAVLQFVEPGGFAALNIDSPLLREHWPAGDLAVATFGWHADADLRLTAVRCAGPRLHFTLNGRFKYELPLAGVHNAVNAAGAITVARRMGLDHEAIAARLASFTPLPMRNEVQEFQGVTVINDAYNANPQSAAAAFDVLASWPAHGRRMVVFGEMRELGAQSAVLHRQVASRLAGHGFDRVYLIGAAAELMSAALGGSGLFSSPAVSCTDVDACLENLAAELREGDVVLLKASRAVGLERLVAALRQRRGAAPVS